MSRIAFLYRVKVGKDVLIAPISKIVKPNELRTDLCQGSAMQSLVQFARTHLDEFSDVEVDAIYQHGYEVTAATILKALENEIKRKDLPKQQLHFARVQEKRLDLLMCWVVLARTRESKDFMDRVYRIGFRAIAGSAADDDIQKSDPEKVEEMKLAGERKLRLWSSQY